jgi:hypothetical protein
MKHEFFLGNEEMLDVDPVASHFPFPYLNHASPSSPTVPKPFIVRRAKTRL